MRSQARDQKSFLFFSWILVFLGLSASFTAVLFPQTADYLLKIYMLFLAPLFFMFTVKIILQITALQGKMEEGSRELQENVSCSVEQLQKGMEGLKEDFSRGISGLNCEIGQKIDNNTASGRESGLILDKSLGRLSEEMKLGLDGLNKGVNSLPGSLNFELGKHLGQQTEKLSLGLSRIADQSGQLSSKLQIMNTAVLQSMERMISLIAVLPEQNGKDAARVQEVIIAFREKTEQSLRHVIEAMKNLPVRINEGMSYNIRVQSEKYSNGLQSLEKSFSALSAELLNVLQLSGERQGKESSDLIEAVGLVRQTAANCLEGVTEGFKLLPGCINYELGTHLGRQTEQLAGSLQVVQDRLSAKLEQLIAGLNALPEHARQNWATVISGLSQFRESSSFNMSALLEEIRKLPGCINYELGTHLSGQTNELSRNLQGMQGELSERLNQLILRLDAMPGHANEKWESVISGLKEFKELSVQNLGIVADDIRKLPGCINFELGTHLAEQTKELSGTLQSMQGGLSERLERLISGLDSLPGRTDEKWESVIAGLKEFKELSVQNLGALVDDVRKLPGCLNFELGTHLSEQTRELSRSLQGMQGGLSEKLETLISGLGSIPGRTDEKWESVITGLKEFKEVSVQNLEALVDDIRKLPGCLNFELGTHLSEQTKELTLSLQAVQGGLLDRLEKIIAGLDGLPGRSDEKWESVITGLKEFRETSARNLEALVTDIQKLPGCFNYELGLHLGQQTKELSEGMKAIGSGVSENIGNLNRHLELLPASINQQRDAIVQNIQQSCRETISQMQSQTGSLSESMSLLKNVISQEMEALTQSLNQLPRGNLEGQKLIEAGLQELKQLLGAELQGLRARFEQVGTDSRDISQHIANIKAFFEQIKKHLDFNRYADNFNQSPLE